MRRVCLKSMAALAKADERVVFIGSDITKRDLEAFADNYPDRFFMEGVYEAHIVGMAAGMALCGKIPYINTIATFLTRRCYEQVLLDVGLHKLPVRLLGSGGGVVYAPLGPTHLANEDIAILRAIPNMTIVAPCDAEEMARLMPLTLKWPGPMYIRFAKGGDKVVSRPDLPFEIGKAIELREGSDALFVTTGITTQIALEAAGKLEGEGLSAAVLHMHTIKPLDAERLIACARRVRAVVTAEEHTIIGGLGSAVAETLLEAGVSKAFKRIGFPDVFTEELGSQNDIMGKYGISVDGLCATALKLLRP
ncbi:MAG: transketolase [Verrucomicrobia bacterium]|nr:transketolase [Verrucomicrobiota bacterium]MBU1908879.1 transketolase [Verrucomicrobiota bacterium]